MCALYRVRRITTRTCRVSGRLGLKEPPIVIGLRAHYSRSGGVNLPDTLNG